MATYEVKGADGSLYHIDGPDDADPSSVIAQVTASHKPQSLVQTATGTAPVGSPAAQASINPTNDMSGLDRFRTGMGKSFVDLVRGAGQMVGLESRQDVADSRTSDAPLMATGAAKAGNFAGNVAAALPAMLIPGANTVAGASLIGAGMGALQPSVSTGETLTNTALGGVLGGAGQKLGGQVGGWAANKLAQRSTAAAEQQSLNSARDAILKQSRAEGYVVPPTAANPTVANTALESIAGKAATRQTAEASNATVSNRLISQDLGLPAGQPLTKEALQEVRTTAGKVYGQVKNAGTITKDQPFLDAIQGLTQTGADLEAAAPGIGAQANEKVSQLVSSLSAKPTVSANDAVGLFKLLNERAKDNFKAAFGPGGADSQALELGRAQKAAADEIGDLIQRHLSSNGQGDLGQQWLDARKLIAKSYTAENALKGNNVDAIRLAAQLRKGAYMDGGFRKVAQFGDQFGEAARVPKSGVGVNHLAAVTGLGGAAFALAHGNLPLAGAAIAGSAIPYAARKAILSKAGQGLLASPSYGPGLLGNAGLQALGASGARGTLPGLMGLNSLVQSSQ